MRPIPEEIIEGVQLVSSVWRPYSGGTSGTSFSSMTYTPRGCREDVDVEAYVGARARLERGYEVEEVTDAVSSGTVNCRSRDLTSSGKWFCSVTEPEPESLEAVTEGSE